MSNYERIKEDVRKEIMASRKFCRTEPAKVISISIVSDALDQLTAAALHEKIQLRKNPDVCHMTIIIPEDHLEYADMYVTAVHEILCEENLSLSVLFIGLHVSLDAIRKIYEENSDTYFYYVFSEKEKTDDDEKLSETDIIYYAYPEYNIMNDIEDDQVLLENENLREITKREVITRDIIRSVIKDAENRCQPLVLPQAMKMELIKKAREKKARGVGFKFKTTSIYAYYTICNAEVLQFNELHDLYDCMVLVSNIVQDKLMENPYSYYEVGNEEYFGNLYKISKKLGLLRRFYVALSIVFQGNPPHNEPHLPLDSDTILWMDRQILGKRND